MDAGLALPLLVALIAVALAFDFLNGMNDAANSIATIVSTRVLRPQYAVAWAAFFNFIAFMVFGLHVAETVGRGIVEANDHRCPRHLRRADRRHRLADHHAPSGHPVVEFARTDRRAGRRRHGQGRLRGGGLGRACPRPSPASCWLPVLGCVTRPVPDADGVVDIPAIHAIRRRPFFPPGAIRLGLVLCAGARRQRCPEDHGHHRGPALLAGLHGTAASMCRSGWCWPARRDGGWAPSPAAGGS